MCYLPGHRAKNSVKSNRKTDLKFMNKIIQHQPPFGDDWVLEYDVNNYNWAVLRVSHNFRDQSKNRHNDGNIRKMMYRRARL